MFLDPMILVSSNRIFWKMKLSWLKCHGEPLAVILFYFLNLSISLLTTLSIIRFCEISFIEKKSVAVICMAGG